MEQKLKGMPETLVVPLWARATETKHDNPIVKDEKARENCQKLKILANFICEFENRSMKKSLIFSAPKSKLTNIKCLSRQNYKF
jgi:O-methyltransferase involved in polyketide biosynthesis